MILDIDFNRLRTLFRGLVVALPLAGAPLALAACGCPESDHLYLLRNPDAETQKLLDACMDPSQHDCMPLCEALAKPDTIPNRRVDHCELHASAEGYTEVHVRLAGGCVGGRLTDGIRLGGARGGPAGVFWAEMAQLEAASVPAFARLGRELRAHGAPAALQVAARRAIGDERRHARVVAGLARRFGGQPGVPLSAALGVRDVEALAVENASEGCVRESYGALLATHQAARATDAGVRRAMARIALDETRHAALAFAVDRWAAARLSATARRRVREARRTAAQAMVREAERPFPPEVAGPAGLPEPPAARFLAARVAALAEAIS